MIIALDVHYGDEQARVGTIAFEAWDAWQASHEWVTAVSEVADYQPGSFYLRELPCLLAAIHEAPPGVADSMTTVIVDGYVWLDGDGRPGLGAHLYAELDERLAVIGVAKNAFAGNDAALAVRRGESERPLFVTTVGCDLHEAAASLAAMHGPYRIPTLLRRVDQLSRGY